MPFGKYRGMAVKSIPNSYLRWLITVEGVPIDVKEEAEKKLEASDYDNSDIQITRHAIDMFSKRFLDKWNDRNIGIATFVTRMAVETLAKGMMVTDERPWGRGIKYFYDDICWVFNWDDNFPEHKSLITIMHPNDKVWKVVREERKQHESSN